MNEKTELRHWYEANPAPSMSMYATQIDYWKAMYEHREAEAHQLSEELIRLRAASPSSKSTKEERPLFDPMFPEQGYVSDAEWAARKAAKADTAYARLHQVLDVVQRYLPPDGLDAEEAMSRITALVDPMPSGVDSSEVSSSDYRTCQFCGCLTNAKVRACCESGYTEDRYGTAAELALASSSIKEDGERADIVKLRELRDIQGLPGNCEDDSYMRGLYNGLELALCVLENREPVYKEKSSPPSPLGDTQPIELKLGQRYRTRNGATLKIVDRTDVCFYGDFGPGNNRRQFKADGRYIGVGAQTVDPWDIVDGPLGDTPDQPKD